MLQSELHFLCYMLQCELLCVWILPVGLDFASGSGLCQWVWNLPVGLDMKTPWARLPAVSCDLHTTMA